MKNVRTKRLLAFIADFVLFIAILIVMTVLYINRILIYHPLILYLSPAIVMIGEVFSGRSPGKSIMKISINDSSGYDASRSKLIIRMQMKLIPVYIMLIVEFFTFGVGGNRGNILPVIEYILLYGWPIYYLSCITLNIRPYWDIVCRTKVTPIIPDQRDEVHGFEVVIKNEDQDTGA